MRFGEVELTRHGDRLGGWGPMMVLVPGVTGQWGPFLNGPGIRLSSIQPLATSFSSLCPQSHAWGPGHASRVHRAAVTLVYSLVITKYMD